MKKPQKRLSARVAQKHSNTRQELIEIAKGILFRDGLGAITLESVAGELGLTKQALYHYFPSKGALIRSLIAALLEDEVTAITKAIEAADPAANPLGTMIQAFYTHYITRLNAFKAIYCQLQLYSFSDLGISKDMIEAEINPLTRRLFDVLQDKLAGKSASAAKRKSMRRLAFTAWLSALGLLTMLSVADAAQDPLIHKDQELLAVLARVFDAAAV